MTAVQAMLRKKRGVHNRTILFIADVHLNSRSVILMIHVPTPWRMVATQAQLETECEKGKENQEQVHIGKDCHHNHAPSPGRARPVVVAVLGWSLFHDK